MVSPTIHDFAQRPKPTGKGESVLTAKPRGGQVIVLANGPINFTVILTKHV